MRKQTRHNTALGLVALAAAGLMLCALASAAAALSPLPRSDYTVRPACGAPSPGHAACMALRLVPQSAAARAHTHPLAVASTITRRASAASEGLFGLTPSDLHTAYQLPTETSGEQTIALVDAYNDLTAESDLKTYDEALGLPACTAANGCFKKVNQEGKTTNLPFPKSSAELKAAEAGTLRQREEAAAAIGWGGEISLDVETAHAICQNCHIVLVEAESAFVSSLEAGERAAEQPPVSATEISNSWGSPETAETPSSSFNHSGTVITASAGDNGYLDWAEESPSGQAEFPASSPYVVAVGGTRLILNNVGHTWHSETVWNDGGVREGRKEGFGASSGGCSNIFEAQLWQSAVADWAEVGCGTKRAVADVAADADPYTGVPVYYTSSECKSEESKGHWVHWCTYGGTSLASPIIASSYALAGGAQGVEYPAQILYNNAATHPAFLHDVFSGSNGECLKPFVGGAEGTSGCSTREEGKSCSLQAICLAHAGYDGPSGVGTPHGVAAFESAPPAETSGEKIEHKEEVERQEEAERHEAAERKAEAEREEAEKAKEKGTTGGEEPSGGTPPPPTGGGQTTTGGPNSGAAPPPVPPVAVSASAPPTPQISALALTLRALFALNASRPRVGQVAFAFTLNTAAQVRVTLARRVRVHGHTLWQTSRNSLTIAAIGGRNSRHLGGRGTLARGLYRLTAAPVHGAARSILFQIG